MSLRYTGEATMDEPALRDVERWKDKIEVRLDNRQVFFLFFGSAMVACMLFVLGVIVGKRLESRGRADAPPMEDPLAALDRFGAVTSPAAAPAALTFPQALIAGGPSKGRAGGVDRSERANAERIERVSAKPTLTATAPMGLAVPVAPVSQPRTVPAPATAPAVAVLAPPAASASLPKTTASTKTTSAQKLAALPRIAVPSPATAPLANVASPTPAKKLVAPTRPGVSTQPKAAVASPSLGKEPGSLAKVNAGVLPGDKAKGRFLLQLSSFQDRVEADTFARRFSGQNAYVVATEIPGKGTWYRVRVGSYGTMQEASAAKTTFERDHNVIAYVAGTGPAK